MPIYEYRCTECGAHFEYMQRMTEDPKTTCETCSGALERLISAAAFHLKGGGWYKDLYASPKPGGSSEGGSKEGGAKDGGAKESSGSSDKNDSGTSSDKKAGSGGGE